MKGKEESKEVVMQEEFVHPHPNDVEYKNLAPPPTMGEHKEHINPPTIKEYSKHISPPEPEEVGMSRFGHHHVSLCIISIVVVIAGVSVVWFYPSSVDIIEKEFVAEELLFTTTTMICENFEDSVCKIREGNVFDKGESVWVVTKVDSTTNNALYVDISFSADIGLPNGEVIWQFFGGYNMKENIIEDNFFFHGNEITTSDDDFAGEYSISLTLTDNIKGGKEVVEKTFMLV